MARNWHPPFWLVLKDKKKGNSNYKDRISLMEAFIKTFGKERVLYVLGDREFIGKEWVDWLNEQGIGYDLRIKENGQYISCARGGMVKAARLFQDLHPGEYRSLGLRRIGKTNGYKALVCGFKTNTGEIVVLIHSACVCEPWDKYRLRWQIECLFRALKTGGFDLEATHITRTERLDTLVGVLAVALCVAYRVGGLVVSIKKPKLRNNGYKPYSIIRYGIDCLIELIRNPFITVKKEVTKVVKFIFKHIFLCNIN